MHFVTEATGFGACVGRADAVFAAGEDVSVYAEPIGFDFTLTLTLKGPPAGDHVLEYTGHDLSSGETAVITMPFSLTTP